ncbi:MAG TPA: hypothetical protein VI136_06360 [Verrucomicrobiae bacterium]
MKKQWKLQRWGISVTTGLALMASVSFCLAQPTITQNFNSGADSASAFGIDFGTGAVEWDSTNGVDGSACLKVTLNENGGAGKEITAKWTFPNGPIQAADYLQVTYKLRIDTTSGVDAEGKLGNWQEVFRDAGGSWDGHWVGAVWPGSYTDWTPMAFAVPNNGKEYPSLDWVLQGTEPYSGNVVFYIDDVVISPVPNPYVWEAFTNDIPGWGFESWALVGTAAWNTTEDAGGGFTPPGCLQLDIPFNSTDWQQSWPMVSVPWAPSRWTDFEFDVKVDAANSIPKADGSYGNIGVSIRDPNWADHLLPPGEHTMTSAYTNWQHVKLSLSQHSTNASSPRMNFWFRGTHGGPIRVYVDNITLTRAFTPPSIVGLEKDPGIGGVRIKMGSGSGDWERNAIVTPAEGTAPSPGWLLQTPATYSMTITNFPDAAKHPGFDAHIYLVSSQVTGNQLSGSADWGAADLVELRVQNNANGTVDFTLRWKTNAPESNAPNIAAQVNGLPSALGTWSLNFTNDNAGYITGPGGVFSEFALPENVPVENFGAWGDIFVQFGAFEGRNDPLNDGQSMMFSHVMITNIAGVIEDNFSGPGLTANNPWRTTSATAVQWLPAGTALWLTWTTPSEGYVVEVSDKVTGPYTDAGVSIILPSGVNRIGAVPSDKIPAGNAAFFRLKK